jgi:hypothetical protein
MRNYPAFTRHKKGLPGHVLSVLLYIWQLPQTMLGFLMAKLTGTYSEDIPDPWGNIKVYRTDKFAGISLGSYIIIGTWEGSITLRHEYGHCLQSRYLGPLYLPVVGIPSFIMAVISRYSRKFSDNYYRRWPENWADKLGGAER